jgi:hypothetical protein
MWRLALLPGLLLGLGISACGDEIPVSEVDAAGLPGGFRSAYESMEQAGLDPTGALVGEDEMPVITVEDGPVVVSRLGKADLDLIAIALFDERFDDYLSFSCGPLEISGPDQEAINPVRPAVCRR